MTDNTQELDEILGRWIKGYINGSAGGFYVTNQTKQDILDWHNKQIEAELEALREEVKHEDLRTISQIITARINKLKENTDVKE